MSDNPSITSYNPYSTRAQALRNGHNWPEIHADIIAGAMSINEIARKYNTPQQTISYLKKELLHEIAANNARRREEMSENFFQVMHNVRLDLDESMGWARSKKDPVAASKVIGQAIQYSKLIAQVVGMIDSKKEGDTVVNVNNNGAGQVAVQVQQQVMAFPRAVPTAPQIIESVKEITGEVIDVEEVGELNGEIETN